MTIALNGLTALVTGAGGGIGREVVKAMAAAGARIIATDLADGADIAGAEAYVSHDVGREADWEHVAGEAHNRFGRLDALVHAAAVSIVGRIEETPLSEWRRVNRINVESIIVGTQILLPLLKEGGRARASGASIVSFSSVGGQRGAAFNAAYCTSKAAVKMLSKCMAAEFAALGYNIRANSVHPGGIETPMLASIIDSYVEMGAAPSRDVAVQAVVANHPIGRLGRPDELGGGVVFLCSDAASFVTGSELNIDGGFTAI